MTFPPNTYWDDDSTCTRTYATLRIVHRDAHPEAVTALLGLEPSDLWVKGELRRMRDGEWCDVRRPNKESRWMLTSDEQLDSRDSLRHIDWVLEGFETKNAEFFQLASAGWEFMMAVYWESEHGDGGPRTTPLTMQRLSDLGIELWYDVYFPYEKPTRIGEAIDRFNDGKMVEFIALSEGA